MSAGFGPQARSREQSGIWQPIGQCYRISRWYRGRDRLPSRSPHIVASARHRPPSTPSADSAAARTSYRQLFSVPAARRVPCPPPDHVRRLQACGPLDYRPDPLRTTDLLRRNRYKIGAISLISKGIRPGRLDRNPHAVGAAIAWTARPSPCWAWDAPPVSLLAAIRISRRRQALPFSVPEPAIQLPEVGHAFLGGG